MGVGSRGSAGDEEENGPTDEEDGRPLPAGVGPEAILVFSEEDDALIEGSVCDSYLVVLHLWGERGRICEEVSEVEMIVNKQKAAKARS